MNNVSNYKISEIKYSIDTAIQLALFDNTKNHDGNKDVENALLNTQTLLYEQFDICDMED